jgi:hypothetical protein
MALSTYSDLQSAVAAWLDRTDLTARIPDFITLAESRLNRTLRLRVQEVETALTVADQGTTVALPSGFVAPMALWVNDTNGRRLLRYIDALQLPQVASSGNVYAWTIRGTNIALDRPTAGALDLIFRWQQSFSLSDASPTNWLLTNHPDAYLFAALVEAGPYLADDKLLTIWEGRLQQALQQIEDKEQRSDMLGSVTPALPFMPSQYDRTRRGYYGGSGGYGLIG